MWRVTGALCVPAATIAHEARDAVAIECLWADDFTELACTDSAPEIDLKKAVTRGHVALGEKEVVL
jgi:hypothetical protein